MTPMRRDQWMRFLTEHPRTAKLATVRADGRPHVAPVWFVVDEDSLVFMTMDTSVKGKNLLRDARVMICVDDETFPYGFVMVEAVASVVRPTSEELLPWARRISQRYVPAGDVEATAARNTAEGELLVRVPFTKVVSAAGVAS